MRPFILCALLCLVAPGLYYVGASSIGAPTTPEGKRYAILIDAGSSGSRIHVHGYTMEGILPQVDASMNLKQKPGLSSFATKPSAVAAALSDLRAFAEEKVPFELRATTPIYLQATAGLRSIPAAQAEAVMEAARDQLQDWGFQFDRSWARILSGREEGINGFVASNYLKGVFSKDGVRQEDTFGVVEMGGASLQVTFCPDDIDALSAEQRAQLATVSIGGNEFHVYTHSYLGYGLEKAAELMAAGSLADIEQQGNPCVLTNTQHSGAGDFDRCLALIDSSLFFDGEHRTGCKRCSFDGSFQPSLKGETFLAIENFFYTTQFFDVEKEAAFLPQLYAKGKAWCGEGYAAAHKDEPDLSKSDMNKYCFSSAYITALLGAGLGFTAADLQTQVHIARTIDGVGIDWALGAVIMAITGNSVDTLSSGWGWVSYLVLGMLLLAAAAIWLKRRRSSRRGTVRYSPV